MVDMKGDGALSVRLLVVHFGRQYSINSRCDAGRASNDVYTNSTGMSSRESTIRHCHSSTLSVIGFLRKKVFGNHEGAESARDPCRTRNPACRVDESSYTTRGKLAARTGAADCSLGATCPRCEAHRSGGLPRSSSSRPASCGSPSVKDPEIGALNLRYGLVEEPPDQPLHRGLRVHKALLMGEPLH